MVQVVATDELQHSIDILEPKIKEHARTFAEQVFKEYYIKFNEMGKTDDYCAKMAAHHATLMVELNYHHK